MNNPQEPLQILELLLTHAIAGETVDQINFYATQGESTIPKSEKAE
jgi:hypothetical protein